MYFLIHIVNLWEDNRWKRLFCSFTQTKLCDVDFIQLGPIDYLLMISPCLKLILYFTIFFTWWILPSYVLSNDMIALITFPVIHIHIYIAFLQPSLRLNVIFQDRHFLVATVNDLPQWISVWTKKRREGHKASSLDVISDKFEKNWKNNDTVNAYSLPRCAWKM